MTRQVAITGMGAVTAAGIGAETLWNAAAAGRSAVRTVDLPGREKARVNIAAALDEATDARIAEHTNTTTDRFAAMALLAAREAFGQANLPGEAFGQRCGIVLGTGAGGAVSTDRNARAFYVKDVDAEPMSVPKVMPNAAASLLSMKYGMTGPALTISTACASSAQAIGLGFELVRSGALDRVIVGGSEAMLTPAVFRAWEMLHVLTPVASRPFSRRRDGMVLGEGAAILVLEAEESARERGAETLALLAGYGTTSDARDMLRPDADGAARAMQLALQSAGLAPDAIGYVNAHGTGTVYNDLAEAEALRTVFGARLQDLPVSSTKPVHGHCIGAAGAIELIVTVAALREQIAPPTINWLGADPKIPLDPVPNERRPAAMGAALCNSFAFGGINASLVVRRA
ncbi:MAG: beta-ketoacyl-[acyl-carrier-protein] synthase family protein [Nitratireductor sp.]|uniref:beta-ketoacyl-[acyl-carrier-protein] synthase family protein n=1 Tax=Nitratireductor sp. TaxID=1872084 RepID=UPI002601BE51|nr:beta-ketoacyl-[acyl-carrier-protein] synthase family protein [Nitratireductor sp.]MCV0352293.1 beta-ketoacyl-[acyl-carrier-protein] synthase family protein [Nitratireductor sp.]